MRVLDLFAGIGGFSVGLEAAGMTTVAFCEPHRYKQHVLKKHWPGVPIYPDIRTMFQPGGVPLWAFKRKHGPIDVVCGGWPCQPYSRTGKRMGAADDRALWREYLRVVKTLRPPWVLGENVADFATLDCDDMLAAMEGIGYACRAFDIPACAVGAIHERRRLFIVAHHQGFGRERRESQALPGIAPQQTRFNFGMGALVGRRSDLPSPGTCGGGDGVRQRLYALGDAVVPQVIKVFGDAIMEAERCA